jgi:murein L,D-transpeptidase YcbB/YkuD
MTLRHRSAPSPATVDGTSRWPWWPIIAIQLCLIAVPTLGAAQVPARIQSLVDAGAVEGMSWPNFRAHQANVREFYAAAGYAPAWFRGATFSPQAISMIQLFQNAWKKGLEPEDYDASRWDGRRQALQRSGADIAGFDVALTACAMRYVSDLSVGRVNPKHVGFNLSVEHRRYDLAQFVRAQVLTASDPAAVLERVEPQFPGYRLTEQAVSRYVELARKDDGEQLPPSDKPIDPGQSYAGLARLTRLLRLVGDLPPEAPGEATPATYSGPVVEAVKRFQGRHGLKDDGRLGATTLKQLNVPLADRVHQLQLALERWRWLPSEFDAPPIIVNIPDFHLRALNADNTVGMDMRVVVGKAMTDTPIFSRDMTYVVFRPYWTVPPGIMRRQIIPAIRKNPDYIAANRYEVTTRDGALVTSGTISDDILTQLQAGKLSVRQKPGPKNALGLVKLMFPNEYHVYLHSTPTTAHFSLARRDFSSGCIRVEKPAELTTWVLRSDPGWPLERVQQAMESGRDNVTVKLAQPIPVFIVYATAIAYPGDEVHFYTDLYGHDAKLTEALAKRHKSP